MTDSNYTHILAVVDRSGSMNAVQGDMRGALDAFFKAQAEVEGKCLVDYVQFDHDYEVVYTDRKVSEAKAVLEPRGMTALLDAIGHSVVDLSTKLKALPEAHRPGKVVVVVITDGFENSSKEWTATTVKALIGQMESEFDWAFTFLGANMDAVSVGEGFGFNPNQSLTYNTSNMEETSSALHAHVTRTRSGLVSGYTSEERQAAVGNADNS